MIPSDLQALYDYEIEQTEENIVLVLTAPDSFNLNCLTIRYDADRNSLAVTAPDIPPICSGKLFGRILPDFEKNIQGNTMRVTFTKSSKQDWPVLIALSADGIDPKSAFLVYVVFKDYGDDDDLDKSVAQEMLAYSAMAGYTPAMRHLADQNLVTEGKRVEGLGLLELAASTYHDPLSIYKLGLIFAYSDDNQEIGFARLRQAAHLGYTQAYLVLGKMLSPLSEWQKFPHKDAKEAIKCFGHLPENAQALHEWAKLALNGVGCKKDVELANRLQAQAKEIDPEIPDLETMPGSRRWVVTGLAVSAVSVLGLACFLKMRKAR